MPKTIHFETKLWEKAFKLVQEDYKKPQSSLLYHYTTAQGLLGILENQNIWATHASFLNDLYEIQYGIDVTKESLDNYSKNKNKFVKKFCKLTMHYLNLMNNKEEEVYIASFCETSDLLSQWKGYTNFGEGYAIGLNFKRLINSKKHANFDHISIKKVIYDKRKQNKIVKSKIKFIIKESLKLIKKDKNNKKNITKACAKSLAYYLNSQCKRFKSSAFSEEKEWRAIYINYSISTKQRVKNRFRITNSTISPYLELNSNNKKNSFLPIHEIVIGPKIDMLKASKSIELIYKNLNKKTPKIIESKITLQ